MNEWLNFLIPKLGKRPKRPRKPLPRSKKRPNIKSKFKANTNPFKIYKARHTPEQVRAYASRCRQYQLDNPTPAVLRFAEILRNLGIDFERERIVFHSESTRFVIVDFWILNHKIAFEVDGSAHRAQQRSMRVETSFSLMAGLSRIDSQMPTCCGKLLPLRRKSYRF